MAACHCDCFVLRYLKFSPLLNIINYIHYAVCVMLKTFPLPLIFPHIVIGILLKYKLMWYLSSAWFISLSVVYTLLVSDFPFPILGTNSISLCVWSVYSIISSSDESNLNAFHIFSVNKVTMSVKATLNIYVSNIILSLSSVLSFRFQLGIIRTLPSNGGA